MKRCLQCKKDLGKIEKIGFRDTCLYCDTDLHTCINCSLRDLGAYNQCHEPNSEWVTDRERNNFCEYFSLADPPDDTEPSREEINARLDKLFKSK